MEISFNSTEIEDHPDSVNSFSDVQDDLSWVMHHVQSLGLKCEESDITPAMVEILHSLFSERNHFQSQTQSLSEFSSEVKSKLTSVEKERDLQKNEITMLKQDLNVSNERNSALRSEQREVKAQWLSEKSELESRHFQTMALCTQTQGTLRKKDRDYEKLQTQLSKISSKSTHKAPARAGSKPDPSAVPLVISKPLRRNHTQAGNPQEGSLQEAELGAARASISALEIENQNLRVAVEDLTANFEDFQNSVNMERQQQRDASLQRGPVTPPRRSRQEGEMAATGSEESVGECDDENVAFGRLSALEQAREVERRLDAVTLTLSAAAAPPSTGFSTPGGKTPRSLPLSLGKGHPSRSLSGTPTAMARPSQWVVKQASTEVKALRERAEKLQWALHPSSASSQALQLQEVLADSTNTPSKARGSELISELEKENETPGKAKLRRNEEVLKDTLHEYRRQLEEACSVICEQDRLIHAALTGNTSSMRGSGNYVEEDEEDEGGDFEEGAAAGSLTPGAKLALGGSYDLSDWSVENFLPSVSPDTMAVLQEADFSTLPPPEPVSLSMAEE